MVRIRRMRRWLRENKTSYKALADEYGCSENHMRQVALGNRASAPLKKWLRNKGLARNKLQIRKPV